MRFNHIFGKMVDEGKMFKRDAWYDERADARGEDPSYVVWQRGYPQGIPINSNTAQATGLPEGTVCYFSPYLMRHFGNNVFAPYQPTQEDLIATDWEPFVRESALTEEQAIEKGLLPPKSTYPDDHAAG